jgi:hypothetical protein
LRILLSPSAAGPHRAGGGDHKIAQDCQSVTFA